MAEGQNHWRSSRTTVLVFCVTVVLFAIVLVTILRPYFSERVVRGKQAPSVKSADLKQTSVVATLDSPMPEHRNVIWCATFQIAWDHFKQDIIKEPVKVLGAEELADRLNRSGFPPGDIERGSFYATAGFVKNGIIKQVQSEMAKRFPSEPGPRFDQRYMSLPGVILAYAYLSVNVGFKYPYYANTYPFGFTDSNGIRTNVTSFKASSVEPDANLKKLREQVEILSCKYDSKGNLTDFAVDLCKDTQPYQVVLATVPRDGTLGETLPAAEKRIADFKNDPDYGELRNLRPIDYLCVPDVLYKLEHSFPELLGKYLGNTNFTDIFIFDARQMIDFSLTRTGVILKSRAVIAAAQSAAPVEKPRDFRFDKPFLIYVKKRQAEAKPFFVMWVDNAELMTRFAAKPGS